MKTIKLRWFNDREIAVTIFFNNLYPASILATVKPQEMADITFDIPEGTIPLVKSWEYGSVLIWADKE